MPDVWTQFEVGYSDIEELLEETGRGADGDARQFAWRWQQTALVAWAARAHLAVEKRIYLRLPPSPQASRLVERGLEEHLAIHEQLRELERAAGCDARTWLSSFEQLRTLLELHAFEAEAVLIPYARRRARHDGDDELPSLLRAARGIRARGRERASSAPR